MADIVTLDGGKITGRGITLGSSWKVTPLAEAHYCWGSTPAHLAPAAAVPGSNQV